MSVPKNDANFGIGTLKQVSVEWSHGYAASTACALSPPGRGSPAVSQIEAVLITKVWIEMNGTCSSDHTFDNTKAMAI